MPISRIARAELRSYRQLPQCWYQIGTKFRDEPRPKGGLLRVREFLMKDAYSFDLDAEGLERSFARMRAASTVIPSATSAIAAAAAPALSTTADRIGHSACHVPNPRSCSCGIVERNDETRPGTRLAQASAIAQPTGLCLWGIADEPPRPSPAGSATSPTWRMPFRRRCSRPARSGRTRAFPRARWAGLCTSRRAG